MPRLITGVRRLKNALTRVAFGHSPTSNGSSGHFTVNAFEARNKYRENYRQIAGALQQLCDFSSVLDLGCANGFLLENFRASGKSIKGFEISEDVIEVLPPNLREVITIGDATKLRRIGEFDLVCCVEVAEHIPPDATEGLLNAITQNASRWIYFTAAPPFQPGHGHINCRQQFYWLNEFRKRGIELDWDRTERFLELIRGIKPAEWLEWNSLILRVNGS